LVLVRLRRDADDLAGSELEHALAREVEEVRFDRGARALYATDASNYRQVPIGLVVPRTVDALVAAVGVCRAHDVPIVMRGGGTSLAGQTCNHAVVIDTSRYLRALEIDAEAGVARVEPGTIMSSLREAARAVGWDFGPDPSTRDRCTLGGMLGNNSCGVHSVYSEFYGPGPRTSDHVLELDVLTYRGERLRAGALDARHGPLHAAAIVLAERYAGEIRARFPDMPRRVSGYNLPDLLAAADLRLVDYHPHPGPIELVHGDDARDFGHAAVRCVGIGKCRKLDSGTMCPSYMVTLDERHSTRGRAHLLFEMLRGDVLRDGWRSAEVREALDLCLACKACKSECPTHVDMASYKAEFMAHHYAHRVRPRQAYAFGRLHTWLGLAQPVAPLANVLGRTRLAKWLAGVAPERAIPRIARALVPRDVPPAARPRPSRHPVGGHLLRQLPPRGAARRGDPARPRRPRRARAARAAVLRPPAVRVRLARARAPAVARDARNARPRHRRGYAGRRRRAELRRRVPRRVARAVSGQRAHRAPRAADVHARRAAARLVPAAVTAPAPHPLPPPLPPGRGPRPGRRRRAAHRRRPRRPRARQRLLRHGRPVRPPALRAVARTRRACAAARDPRRPRRARGHRRLLVPRAVAPAARPARAPLSRSVRPR
jgi:ferredoxin